MILILSSFWFTFSLSYTYIYSSVLQLFASGGGGCCDCGDPEAWTSFVHCDIHKPSEHDEQNVDPVEALPSDLVDRARPFFSALLWYCMKMLCWEDPNSLPPTLMQAHTDQWYAIYIYVDKKMSVDVLKVVLVLAQC
jgi:hypothetical protein